MRLPMLFLSISILIITACTQHALSATPTHQSLPPSTPIAGSHTPTISPVSSSNEHSVGMQENSLARWLPQQVNNLYRLSVPPTPTTTTTPSSPPTPQMPTRDHLVPLKREGHVPPDYIPSETPEPTATLPSPAEPTVTITPSNTPQPTIAPTILPPPPPQPSPSTQPIQPVRVVIEAIGLDRPVFAVGLDADNLPVVLRHDIGWYRYSALPRTGDNVVLWGHVLRFKDSPNIPAPFANLHQVTVGTPIVLYTARGTAHTYVVAEHIYATPDQVNYILPQGSEMLTLVSCIGDQVITDTSVEMSHRLITRALPLP